MPFVKNGFDLNFGLLSHYLWRKIKDQNLWGVMVIVVVYGHDDTSSNPGPG